MTVMHPCSYSLYCHVLITSHKPRSKHFPWSMTAQHLLMCPESQFIPASKVKLHLMKRTGEKTEIPSNVTVFTWRMIQQCYLQQVSVKTSRIPMRKCCRSADPHRPTWCRSAWRHQTTSSLTFSQTEIITPESPDHLSLE